MGRRKKYKKRKAVAKPIEPVQESVKKRVSRYMYIPFALALLLYANTIGNDYVLDDALAVLQNEHVQKGLSALPEIFTSNFLDGVGHFNDGLYRPLVVCTYALEHQLAGNSPVLSHAVNILLYALCGLLLFLLLRAIFRDRTEFFSLAICLLFIAHPIHTEAVANIKGRDEILAFLSFTLSAFFLFRYIDRDNLQGLLLSLLFFILALLSKESAFTLALILPLMPWFFRDVGIRKVLGVFASFFAIALLMWLWRSHVIHSMPNPVDSGIVSALNNSLLSTDSFSDRLATGLYMQVMYIGKMIFPHPLLHDYSYNQIPTIHLGSVPAIFSVFILGCIAFVVIKGFGKKRLFAFAMLFFFITLAATSNLFVFIGATFAERFLFTPALGFSIAIIALFPGLMKARATTLQGVISANKLFSSLMMVLLVGYAVLTIDRNTDWKDNYRLFAADMPYLRHSARAHYNYGTALFESAAEMKDGDEKKRIARRAASELSKAVAIYPAYHDALNNLGNSYRSANMPDSAITVLKQLIEQAPDYQKAYMNLGLAYFQNNDFEEAIGMLEQYLKFEPASDAAAYTLGISYGNLQRFERAQFYLKKAYAINPGNVNALKDLGAVYGMTGDHKRALEVSLKAYQLDPKDANLLRNIALTYRFLGQEGKSQEFLRMAQQIDPSMHL